MPSKTRWSLECAASATASTSRRHGHRPDRATSAHGRRLPGRPEREVVEGNGRVALDHRQRGSELDVRTSSRKVGLPGGSTPTSFHYLLYERRYEEGDDEQRRRADDALAKLKKYSFVESYDGADDGSVAIAFTNTSPGRNRRRTTRRSRSTRALTRGSPRITSGATTSGTKSTTRTACTGSSTSWSRWTGRHSHASGSTT